MFKAISDTNQLYVPFFRRSLPLLALLFLITEGFQNYFLILIEATRETQSVNFAALIGQMLTSMLEFVALTMLVPLRIMEHQNNVTTPQSFTHFTQKHIGPLTAESLRSLAITLIWSIALILPGIFKYVRLSFVPYVVVADTQYQNGERDALEYSNQLVKGITFNLFCLFVVLLLLELARGWMREQFPLMQVPHISLAASLLFYSINIYANILLFRIYQLRVKVLPGAEKEISHAT